MALLRDVVDAARAEATAKEAAQVTDADAIKRHLTELRDELLQDSSFIEEYEIQAQVSLRDLRLSSPRFEIAIHFDLEYGYSATYKRKFDHLQGSAKQMRSIASREEHEQTSDQDKLIAQIGRWVLDATS